MRTAPQPPPRIPSPPPQPSPPAPAGPLVLRAGAPDPVADRLLAERIVMLGGELDDAAARRVVGQLLLLDALDPRRDVTLVLSCPGGPVAAATAVHDAMRLVRPDVATLAIGVNAGTGVFLLAAGAPGKRRSTPHARLLLRAPAPAGLSGEAVHRDQAGEMLELTARYTGRPLDEVAADAARGRWFTAQEAVSCGLADHVSAPGTSLGVP